MRLGKLFHRARKAPVLPVIGIVATEILIAVMNSRQLKRLEASVAARRARS